MDLLALLYCFGSPFWQFFYVLEKSRISKMADPKWRLFGNYDVIYTLYDVFISCCVCQKKHLWTFYIPCKPNTLGVTEEERNPLPGLKRPKKPGLNRVKLTHCADKQHILFIATNC